MLNIRVARAGNARSRPFWLELEPFFRSGSGVYSYSKYFIYGTLSMTMTMAMARARGRVRSRSQNLSGAGAGAGNFKNGRLWQPC